MDRKTSQMSFHIIVLLMIVICRCEATLKRGYTAAVYEHARIDEGSPKEMIESNLKYYRRATNIAKKEGADIIVFPEYGIFHPNTREELKEFLEYIPNPKEKVTNPCIETQEYDTRPILYALSCIARYNSIVVVANTGDIQPCEGQPDCPSDGVFHFNTNVAFDKDGRLLAKYHKEHLFFESGMDLAREQQDPTFETDFGTFAMFICFDLVFKRISEVASWKRVDAVLLTTMWIDPAPLMTSVQIWQSWAMGNNATFMAANIQLPGYQAVGSGIFQGRQGPRAYTFNPDGVSKLVIAAIPWSQTINSSLTPYSRIITITKNESMDQNDGCNDAVPYQCSKKVLGEPTDIHKDYRCLEENTKNYTFVKLGRPKGRLEACNNGMCCRLDYVAKDMKENFYLGVYNGTYNMFDRYYWCEENCLLVKCDALDDNPCATFPLRSNTTFKYVRMEANFTTNYVYPSVINSGMKLVPLSYWNYRFKETSKTEKSLSLQFESERGKELLIVGLNGRCYDRDPPYKR